MFEVEIALEVVELREPLRERHREQEANRIWTQEGITSSWKLVQVPVGALLGGLALRPAVVLSATPEASNRDQERLTAMASIVSTRRLGRVDRALEQPEDVLPADHDHRVDPVGEERASASRQTRSPSFSRRWISTQ